MHEKITQENKIKETVFKTFFTLTLVHTLLLTIENKTLWYS